MKNVAALEEQEERQATRNKVARSILSEGPRTAAELASSLGLTPAGVRRHLDALLASADDDETYVVVHRGELRTSTRAALPPVRGRALERRLRALRDDTPGADRWSAGPGL